ncbi:rhomboid family intramembrane serine protease [Rhizobium sp. CG5]|uniref:rhomboid family intramembrane serine protease n=1 Tax=Rhizobium sp. CG5 TaxID=2726076 RepID=UPI0020333DDF|nr:rhomboid family intramembrane serine protease [Rhizobium sp. CG5]MCM2475203.1 rhomboid family intramembrane serine protease [Rhizobium sp. CG5]
MFIPLHDRNALKHIDRQYVTLALISINVFVWIATGLLATDEFAQATVVGLGFIPAVAFEYATLDPALVFVPEDATAITYAFLHGDFLHLASNMVFLWVFGDNVEDALGHIKYLIFYLVCAVAAALFHGLVVPTSESPLIGASGAVAGIVAAYIILHPKVRVWVLVLFRFPIPLPAFIPLAFWIGQQFWMLASDHGSNVSWGAHVGGILAGALLVVPLRRRGVPLFDRTIVTPKAIEHLETTPPAVQPSPAASRKTIHWGR